MIDPKWALLSHSKSGFKRKINLEVRIGLELGRKLFWPRTTVKQSKKKYNRKKEKQKWKKDLNA